MIFVEGVPRSGTSWLSVLLATHPAVAGIGSESHLFDIGVGALFDNHVGGHHGTFLSAYVSREELVDDVRQLCDLALLRMRDRTKPAASVIMEKTPLLYEAGLVLRRKRECFPDASYLHVVRDPDEVGRSLALAPFIGETDTAVCAGLARTAESEIRAALSGHPRTRELRYEALVADPVDVMEDIYSWLGLPPDPGASERIERLSLRQFAMTGRAPAKAGLRPLAARCVGAIRRAFARPAARAWPKAATSSPAAILGILLNAAGEGRAGVIRELTVPSFELKLQGAGHAHGLGGDTARRAVSSAVGRASRRGTFVDVSWSVVEQGKSAAGILSGVDPAGTEVELSFRLWIEQGRISRLVADSGSTAFWGLHQTGRASPEG